MNKSTEIARLIEMAIPIELETKAPGDDNGPRRLTDLGNAERFNDQHKRKIVFDVREQCWRIWKGKVWLRDRTKAAHRLAHKTVRSIYREAERTKDTQASGALAAWAHKSESCDRINGMLSIAASLEGMTIAVEEWDANPWLLNCQNGTVNLKNGKLQPHQATDFITKIAPVEFNENATHDIWDKVLNEALPDKETRDFFQRLLGYGLCGTKYEKAFGFILGPHDTAKSTVIEAVQRTLGDYQATIEPEAVMRKDFNNGSSPTPEIARLAGVRLVVTSETNEGQKLNVGLIKRLSGGNARLSGRVCRGNTFEFDVAFLLVFESNYRPMVPDDDSAFYTRAKVIPFNNIIPEERRDRAIKETLDSDPAARSAILSWLVAGCIAWQRQGLGHCLAVKSAVNAYADSMNMLSEFFDENCVFGSQFEVTSAALRAKYDRWVKETGIRQPLSPNKFAEKLHARGCADERISSGEEKGKKKWIGIGLRDAFGEAGEAGEGKVPLDTIENARMDIYGAVASPPSPPSLSPPDSALPDPDDGLDEATV